MKNATFGWRFLLVHFVPLSPIGVEKIRELSSGKFCGNFYKLHAICGANMPTA
jgi:hypothetical protein